MTERTGIDFLNEWNEASKLMFLSAVVPGTLFDAISEATDEDFSPLQFLDHVATVGMVQLAQRMIEPYVRQVALRGAKDKGEMMVKLAMSLFLGLADKKAYENTHAWKVGDKFWLLSEEFLAGTPWENFETFTEYLEKNKKESSK